MCGVKKKEKGLCTLLRGRDEAGIYEVAWIYTRGVRRTQLSREQVKTGEGLTESIKYISVTA